MQELKLSKEKKQQAATKIQKYMEGNFDSEIGNLEAEIFVDYLTDVLGKYFYDQGIIDAKEYVLEKAEEMFLLMMEEEK